VRQSAAADRRYARHGPPDLHVLRIAAGAGVMANGSGRGCGPGIRLESTTFDSVHRQTERSISMFMYFY